MISESCDPAEFVRAAVGWDRMRLEAELDRELAAAELECDRAQIAGGRVRAGSSGYINFLKRARAWLQSGHVSPQMRREIKALLMTLAEALVARGQLDEAALASLLPRKPRVRPSAPQSRRP